jgi:hypothetical protein
MKLKHISPSFEDMVRQYERDPYEDTGRKAPPEVQEAVQRWTELSDEERAAKPLLYWLLGSGTPPYKMSQEESQYTNNSKTKGQTCGNCEFAYLKIANKKFICSQIRGHIQPSGWCNRWKAQK